jgi:hypothetical protein
VDFTQAHLGKIDLTQDVAGFFYVCGDYQQRCQELRQYLARQLERELVVGRNSFSSCFYFEEPADENKMTLKVKIYNKGLCLLQSRTARK